MTEQRYRENVNSRLILLLVVLLASVAITTASVSSLARWHAARERSRARSAATAIDRATASPEPAARAGILAVARSLDTRNGAIILTVRLINDSDATLIVREGDTLQVTTEETAVHVHPLDEAVLAPNGHMDIRVPLPNDGFVEVRYVSGRML